jgi:octaprenyl-diphosphate synthase
VLDEADERRQAETVNRIKGNEVAVILGDYLIARAFHLCSTLDSQRIALRVGEVTGVVCEGEMLQLSRRGDPSLAERTYFDIIERKTAALIGVACELGAAASGADPATQRRMYDFGVKLGNAFQIVDDLLDLVGDQRVVGKSLHKDLEKGKMTLPVIHHLRSVPPSAPSRVLIESMIRGEVAPDAEAVARALDTTGSLAYSRRTATDLVTEARALLATLPESPARQLMHALAEAVVSREF